MTPQITVLDNGLTIITDTMPHIPSVSINVGVNNGSRYEPVELNGISHFLEHMAFKGTKRRSARQIAEEFDAIGGYLNAATDRENTIYHAKLLKEDVRLAIDILADILQHSVFAADEITRECMVIEQEIAQSNDTPDDIIFDYFMNTALPDQPLGRNILGTVESIGNFNGDTFRSYMRRYYSGPRMVLAAVGNIEHRRIVELAGAAFNALPPLVEITREPYRYQGGILPVVRDLEQVNVVFGLQGISYHDPDYYTMQMLSTILGGGMSSRLFQEIREKRGLAYSIQSFTSSYEDGGMFGIFPGTGQDQLSELLDVTIDELRKLTDHIDDNEMSRARAQIRAGLLMVQESSSFRAEELVRNMLSYKRHVPVTEIIGIVDAISRDDLYRLAGKLLISAPPTLAAIGQVHLHHDTETLTSKLRA